MLLMAGRRSLDLELQDGQKQKVLITDLEGVFTVTGSLV